MSDTCVPLFKMSEWSLKVLYVIHVLSYAMSALSALSDTIKIVTKEHIPQISANRKQQLRILQQQD